MKANPMHFYDKADLVAPITDDEIEEMLAVMKPALAVYGDNWLREVNVTGVDRRGISYIWEPTFIGEPFLADTLGSAVIPTFHCWGAPALFKPSLAETLAAIRRYCPEWRSVRYFALQTEGLGAESIIGRYHQTRCTLITRALVIEDGSDSGRLVPKDDTQPTLDCHSGENDA